MPVYSISLIHLYCICIPNKRPTFKIYRKYLKQIVFIRLTVKLQRIAYSFINGFSRFYMVKVDLMYILLGNFI